LTVACLVYIPFIAHLLLLHLIVFVVVTVLYLLVFWIRVTFILYTLPLLVARPVTLFVCSPFATHTPTFTAFPHVGLPLDTVRLLLHGSVVGFTVVVDAWTHLLDYTTTLPTFTRIVLHSYYHTFTHTPSSHTTIPFYLRWLPSLVFPTYTRSFVAFYVGYLHTHGTHFTYAYRFTLVVPTHIYAGHHYTLCYICHTTAPQDSGWFRLVPGLGYRTPRLVPHCPSWFLHMGLQVTLRPHTPPHYVTVILLPRLFDTHTTLRCGYTTFVTRITVLRFAGYTRIHCRFIGLVVGLVGCRCPDILPHICRYLYDLTGYVTFLVILRLRVVTVTHGRWWILRLQAPHLPCYSCCYTDAVPGSAFYTTVRLYLYHCPDPVDFLFWTVVTLRLTHGCHRIFTTHYCWV